MANIVLLFVCLMAGVVLRLSGRLPDDAPAALNGLVVNLALPALALQHVHGIQFDSSLAAAVAMPWILFALGATLFWALSKALALPRETTGALMLVGGLGNTSFIGLPMIEAFFGPRYIPIGIAIDQLGSYLVLSTAGILIASLCSGAQPSAAGIFRRIATFPPLIAVAAALALAPVSYPEWLTSLLERLGNTVVPLALVSIGLQLRASAIISDRAALAAGLGFKLILGPAAIATMIVLLYGHFGETARVTLFEAAMAPMIGASVIAMQYRLNNELTSVMVGAGTLASFATLPVWWDILQLL